MQLDVKPMFDAVAGFALVQGYSGQLAGFFDLKALVARVIDLRGGHDVSGASQIEVDNVGTKAVS